MSATFFEMRRRLAAAKKPEPVVEPVADPVDDPVDEPVDEPEQAEPEQAEAVDEEKPKGRKKKE